MDEARWERARPLIEAALGAGRGAHTFGDIQARWAAGQCDVWLADRAVAVTEIYRSHRPTLHIWLAAGDLEEIEKLRVGIEAYATGKGFARVTTSPLAQRAAAWFRATAKAAGYRPELVTFSKELG